MKRFILGSVLVAALAIPFGGVASATCVRTDDACVSTSGDGTVDASVDVGAIDAQANVGPSGGGATADAGAIDVQAGTDRPDCADAGAINVPPDQKQCPPG